MNNNKVPAIAFLISGLFMVVCCFLPLKTLTVTGGLMDETSTIKYMPSVGGFFVLLLAGMCVVFPIIGYKSYSALAGTGTAILGGGLLWYYTNSAELSASQVSQVSTIMDGMFSSTSSVATTVTVTTNVGFSLTIIALILCLVTGFWYTFVDET